MEINGIAHTFLTVNNFPRAKAFYAKLLPYLGLTAIIDSDDTYYCIGGKTGVAIRASEDISEANKFNQANFRQLDQITLNRFTLHLGKTKRAVTVFSSEPGLTAPFSVPISLDEPLKRQVNSLYHFLEHLRMNLSIPGAILFELHQALFLTVIVGSFPWFSDTLNQ